MTYPVQLGIAQEKNQPDSIWGYCYSCFLKGFTDWTIEQLVRLGKREEDKYTTCRRTKWVKTRSGEHVCVYKGANDTYEMAIEFDCPPEYQCKYNPNGKEPSIDSVVDSLNGSFKK